MLAAVGKKSAIDYPSLVSQMSQYVETSLSYQEMISLATVLLGKDINLSTYTIPSDEENAIGGSNGPLGYGSTTWKRPATIFIGLFTKTANKEEGTP